MNTHSPMSLVMRGRSEWPRQRTQPTPPAGISRRGSIQTSHPTSTHRRKRAGSSNQTKGSRLKLRDESIVKEYDPVETTEPSEFYVDGSNNICFPSYPDDAYTIKIPYWQKPTVIDCNWRHHPIPWADGQRDCGSGGDADARTGTSTMSATN